MSNDCSPRANGPGSFRGFLPANVASDLAACAASGGGIRTFNATATAATGSLGRDRGFFELLGTAFVVSWLVSYARG